MSLSSSLGTKSALGSAPDSKMRHQNSMSGKDMPLTTPPPQKYTTLSFPTPQILLVTINRAAHLNSIHTAGHWELHALWEWYDAEPSLRCAIITGASGGKQAAFCAGQDLKEWHMSLDSPPKHPPSGFGGLSQRTGKKPVIAAIAGLCLGGGLEMVLNADLAIATAGSTFALPEARIGVAAFAGALPRLTLLVGLPRASELALMGRVLTAREAEAWGIVNRIVERDVVAAAVEMAERVTEASPDSVIVSRAGLRSAWSGEDVEVVVEKVWNGIGKGLQDGENIREGLQAFVERRKPKWKDSKL